MISKLFLSLIGLPRSQKRAVQLAADALILVIAFALSMLLRLESLASLGNPWVWAALLPVIPVTLALFIRLGFYRAVVRYMAGRAVTTVLLGAVASGTTLAVAAFWAELPIPRSVPLIYTALIFLLIGGLRFVFRELLFTSQNRGKEPVLIYGAGAAGRQLLQILRQGQDFAPVAFIDDEVQAQGTQLGGLRVLPPKNLEAVIASKGVTSILLAIPSATRARRSEVLKSLERLPVHLRTVPGLEEIMSGKSSLDQINDISIEDLLGRDPVPPQPELLHANIKGKNVLVTGAGGSIGSELCRQILRQEPKTLVLFELSELALYSIEQDLLAMKALHRLEVEIRPVMGSVQSQSQVARVLRAFNVQTVYHAAAYKHVPLVELNVVEGIRNNVFGTRKVAEASIAAGVEAFILVSTDKAVRPTNVMGASKRMAEMVCQTLAKSSSKTTVSMVRFGNVLGSSGSVIPLFRRQIAAGGPITVTHPEITRFFMTIPEAALLVIQAGAMAKGGEVFVLDMGEPVRIAELASQMVRLHGKKPVLLASGEGADNVGPGEIGITFTRLRPGEKLYEELLIGNDPKATAHPRILSASEIFLTEARLRALLEDLAAACETQDIARIRKILVDAETSYQPHDEIVDLGWAQNNTKKDRPSLSETTHLSLVKM